ncbi:S49 family peptidase [Salipiger thiooxidans]|uniref:S49 family peptidase n=1 Tax=Salipiger thiooxidans TaxID=282683 RepID=UPI001CFC0818|nr:S49 family peptidase [Salipiger thiooxidans]
MRHPQIAARVFHTPLLAAPAKAAAFIMGLGPRLIGAEAEFEVVGAEATPEASRRARASLLDERLEDEIRGGRRSAYRVRDGIAIIPATGTLVHRGAWLGQSSGETSYEGLSAQLEMARRDGMVRGVGLELDSFGGEVAGCFALADQIRGLREEKPVWAFISDHAFSAGYALASQATRIVMPRTAGAGSIGVICMHADRSEALQAMGVKVTVISAGNHKADGNPYEPLPEAVRADLQAEMEYLRGVFAETVALGRGDRLTAEAALATEARCLTGKEAVDAGLADEIANPREAFEAFADDVNGRALTRPQTPTAKGGSPMSGPTTETTTPTAATPPAATTPTPAPAPEAAAPTATAPAPAEPAAEDPKARIAAILKSPEAKGREDLAQSFAFNSDMPSAEAIKHLAAAPKSDAAAPASLSATIDAEATELDAPAPDAGASAAPSIAERAAKRHGAK